MNKRLRNESEQESEYIRMKVERSVSEYQEVER
jgi:hypothetical protein